MNLLEDLTKTMTEKETFLLESEKEPLPDILETVKDMITKHQEFMDDLSSYQPKIDSVCKPTRGKTSNSSSTQANRRQSKYGNNKM